VLLAKMTVFEDELAIRERIARTYAERLAHAVQVPARVPDSISAWSVYSILLPTTATRDALQTSLRNAGIPTAIYYPKPLHHQPAYRDHHDGTALPVSEDLAGRILALPIHPDLTQTDLDRICTALTK